MNKNNNNNEKEYGFVHDDMNLFVNRQKEIDELGGDSFFLSMDDINEQGYENDEEDEEDESMLSSLSSMSLLASGMSPMISNLIDKHSSSSNETIRNVDAAGEEEENVTNDKETTWEWDGTVDDDAHLGWED